MDEVTGDGSAELLNRQLTQLPATDVNHLQRAPFQLYFDAPPRGARQLMVS
ncbi:hypothetical protein ACWGS9_34935 [Bradyrhizobium sp. Arg314]